MMWSKDGNGSLSKEEYLLGIFIHQTEEYQCIYTEVNLSFPPERISQVH